MFKPKLMRYFLIGCLVPLSLIGHDLAVSIQPSLYPTKSIFSPHERIALYRKTFDKYNYPIQLDSQNFFDGFDVYLNHRIYMAVKQNFFVDCDRLEEVYLELLKNPLNEALSNESSGCLVLHDNDINTLYLDSILEMAQKLGFNLVANQNDEAPFYLDARRFEIDKMLMKRDVIHSESNWKVPLKGGLIRKLKGGMCNEIWHVRTLDRELIVRKLKDSHGSCFNKTVEVSKHAYELGLSPEVLFECPETGELVLEYIEPIDWPNYHENALPYKKAMQMLRFFQDNLKAEQLENSVMNEFYAPFDLILSRTLEGLPSFYYEAKQKVQDLYKEFEQEFKKAAVLCHGDFNKNNVLLTQAGVPKIIDFDSASLGDPYFDLVKFSIGLTKHQQQELFKVYLGHEPTTQELDHYFKSQGVFLMLVATIRFAAAEKAESAKFSLFEMNQILEKDEMPHYLDLKIDPTDAKTCQLGALSALKEFWKMF